MQIHVHFTNLANRHYNSLIVIAFQTTNLTEGLQDSSQVPEVALRELHQISVVVGQGLVLVCLSQGFMHEKGICISFDVLRNDKVLPDTRDIRIQLNFENENLFTKVESIRGNIIALGTPSAKIEGPAVFTVILEDASGTIFP